MNLLVRKMGSERLRYNAACPKPSVGSLLTQTAGPIWTIGLRVVTPAGVAMAPDGRCTAQDTCLGRCTWTGTPIWQRSARESETCSFLQTNLQP
jgi:hypothetical protein